MEVDLPSLRVESQGRVAALAAAPGAEPLALSPDGRWLATVRDADPDLPVLYDTSRSATAPVVLPRQRQPVNALAFAPNSRTLAVASASGDVSVDSVDGAITGSYAGVEHRSRR